MMEKAIWEIMETWGVNQRWINDAVGRRLKEMHGASSGYGRICYQCDRDGITIRDESMREERFTWLRFGKMVQAILKEGEKK